MWKVLLLVIGSAVLGSLILPAAFWIGSFVVPPSQPVARIEWRWAEEKASLAYSIRQHLPDYEVELVLKNEFYTPINIRTKEGKRLLYHLDDGHQEIVFTRHEDTLFIAEYWTISTGCEVVAIDLGTGKQLWRARLNGIGSTGHSKYRNRVNIETDGEKIIIYGNESHGRYVEHLDINSGRMLLNKQFEPLRK